MAEDSLHMIFANLFTCTEFAQCSAFVRPDVKVGAMKEQLSVFTTRTALSQGNSAKKMQVQPSEGEPGEKSAVAIYGEPGMGAGHCTALHVLHCFPDS